MPLGPVFSAELLTTARRARYYVIRFFYGLIILFQIYVSYESSARWAGAGTGRLSIHQMADFASGIFSAFAILQAVVVVLLTPALVGGAIADEKQRKTLHYLLASELTSFEIVGGKLAARLLQVLVLVALGLPVVSLIGLFGGIDPQVLLLSYGATITTIYFLSTASILVSTVSKRPRDAISLLYMLEIAWLIVPSLLIGTMRYWVQPWPTIAEWVNPVLQYVAVTSPVFFATPLAYSSFGGPYQSALWGMGMQVAYGTIFFILATLRLRPVYRKEGGTSPLAQGFAKLTGKRRWFPRPACGDDAMLWKERYVSRTGGLTKAALAILGIAMVGIIGYSAYGFIEYAINEISRDGYFTYGQARTDFNYFLRGVSTTIYILWALGVASSAASGLSSEREEDQWISLLSTPLSGQEILRAKMIGPVWGLRLVAYLMFLLWGVGLLLGSIHPFGLFACLVEFVVFTWFITALGNWFSLRARNSTRSLASTMAVLIFLNGGYLFCCIPFQPDTPAVMAGFTPAIFTMSLLSVPEFGDLPTGYKSGDFIAACIIGVIGYGAAALGLTASMFASFDRIVDRPARSGQNQAPRQPVVKARTADELPWIEEVL